MRILNIEPKNYSNEARSWLGRLGEIVEVEGSRQDLLRLVPNFEVLIVRFGHRIDKEVLEKATRLKVIVSATTGLNHIDVKAAEEHGIKVLSLQGEIDFLEKITATAELTWSLILSVVRKIPTAHKHVVSGNWNRDPFKGRDLRNKSIGIIGYGRIGKMIAEYAQAFRMVILATDPYVHEAPDWVSLVDQLELLAKSDIVTLHVPLTSETKGFFGAKEFGRMCQGSFFINTSRGEVVDERALLEALRSGHLAGAGLDVLSNETSKDPDWLSNNPLLEYAKTHDNLILTPHIGGATVESMEETELFMVRKLNDFLSR